MLEVDLAEHPVLAFLVGQLLEDIVVKEPSLFKLGALEQVGGGLNNMFNQLRDTNVPLRTTIGFAFGEPVLLPIFR